MIKFYPSVFNGTLKAPASRAHAQRLLFAAALPAVPTTVKNIPPCDDIKTTVDCLEAFGCRVAANEAGNEAVVEPFPKNFPMPYAKFDFKRSASVSRFAIALAAAHGYRAECEASPDLSKRLLVPLTSRLALNGVTFSSFSFPLSMHGRLTPGDFIFEGGEDGEFISALLMALPLLSSESTVRIESPLSDSSFVGLTLDVLKNFGIDIEHEKNIFHVKGRRQYISPVIAEAENDWSLAALWTGAGALSEKKGGRVKVYGLPESSSQQYRAIKPAFSLIAQDFSEISLDASKYPELTSFFAAAAILKGASFNIQGVPQLRFMESDRLKTMAECAEKSGGSASYTDDSLRVRGNPSGLSKDYVIDCKNDPWVFMSFAAASAAAKEPFILSDAGPEKLYGRFFEDYESIGGKYEKIS